MPKPFCSIDIFIAPPIWPQQGEPIEQYRRRIEQSLRQLETSNDPSETKIVAAHQEHSHPNGNSISTAA
jgi:hypothetical protein